jgi:hypothetical protein
MLLRDFAGNDIDKEIKHIGLGDRLSDIGSLESATLRFFGVNPCSHGEFSYENITAFCE